MANGPITIPDVARAAGVATATAARALGDYGPVSETTRAKVLAAAQALGYRPNALARSMVTGRTNSLGLVVADIENPFFAAITRAVSDAARSNGYEVLLANSDEDLSVEQSAIQLFMDKRVDGMIVAPASSTSGEHLQAARDSGAHLVVIDRRVRGLTVDSVTVHNRVAAQDAVRRLVEAGHRRIGYLRGLSRTAVRDGQGQRISTGDDRLLGYRQALREAGLDAHRYVRVGGLRRHEAMVAARSLLEDRDRPTAILTPDSVLALGVLLAVKQTGLRVPEELSLISFDDSDWAEVVTPGLSVISQPVHALGAQAVSLLMERIRGFEGPPRHKKLAATFIERASVAHLATRRPVG